MLKLLDWLRRLDFRSFTPLQWGMFVVAVLFALALLNFVLNLAMSLLPIAVLVVVIYVAYNVLTSQSEGSGSKLKRSDSAKPKREEVVKPKREEAAVKASRAEDQTPERLVIVDEPPQSAPNANDIAAQLEERRRRLLRGSGE